MKLLKNNYLAHSYINSLLQYKECLLQSHKWGSLMAFCIFILTEIQNFTIYVIILRWYGPNVDNNMDKSTL